MYTIATNRHQHCPIVGGGFNGEKLDLKTLRNCLSFGDVRRHLKRAQHLGICDAVVGQVELFMGKSSDRSFRTVPSRDNEPLSISNEFARSKESAFM